MKRMFRSTLLKLALIGFQLSAQDHRCIDAIYDEDEPRNTPDFEFDRTFAGDADGSYSCRIVMRPSAMRTALEQFRFGVLYRDATSIKSVVHFPVTARVSKFDVGLENKVKIVRIRDVKEWFAFQDEYFSKIHLALVACAYMGNVTPVGGRAQGVMIGTGTFWFQAPADTRKVSMTAVNLSPKTAEALAKACIPPGAEGN